MSFPIIPNMTPLMSVTTAQTIPLLSASIALEELALAHMLNAEAEKLQFVLGTLPPGRTTFSPATVSLTNLLAIDASVQRTLRDAIMKEQLLEFKFENILDLIASGTAGTGGGGGGPTCGCSVATVGGLVPVGPITFTFDGLGVVAASGSLNLSICPSCQANGSFFNLILAATPTPPIPAFPIVLNISATDITSIACDATGVTIIGTANLLVDGTSVMVGFNIRINNSGTVTLTLTSNGVPILTTTIPGIALNFTPC